MLDVGWMRAGLGLNAGSTSHLGRSDEAHMMAVVVPNQRLQVHPPILDELGELVQQGLRPEA